MIYSYEMHTFNIEGLSCTYTRDLLPLVEAAGEEGLTKWATCFKQNDPGDKVLRNIKPMQIRLVLVENPRYHASSSLSVRYILKAYENDRYEYGRRKEVKIESNNSHGHLTITDTIEEASRCYNLKIRNMLSTSEVTLERRIKEMSKSIEFLKDSILPGY